MDLRTAARVRSPGIRKTVLIGAFVLALGLGAIFAASASAATITYNLYATDGYITMADGTVVYIYGFVGGRAGEPLNFQASSKPVQKGVLPNQVVTIPTGAPDPTPGVMTAAEASLFGNAQFPAPVIYAAKGDVIEIRLKNLGVANGAAPNDPHTIHLHGLDVNAANDGVPETSVATVPANSPKGTAGAGNVVVYMFAPEYEGTYMYHCHQEADIHVQMGMYGALVVYNPTDEAYLNGGPGKGFGGDIFGWKYDKDYILLLSEFDLGQHKAEQQAGAAGGYNPVNFKPQYWFVNGLSFPNTVHAGLGFVWADWIASHPNYDPFITGSISGGTSGTPGEKVLLRVINMGFQTQPMHMHGYHAKIVGSDQRAWPWANQAGVTPYGQGLEKNTLTIGSGETYEWIIDFGQQNLNGTYDWDTKMTQQAAYPGGTQTRYTPGMLPASNTLIALPAIPDLFAPGFAYTGGPLVGPDGQQGIGGLPAELPIPVAAGVPPTPTTVGQYFPFHNHDDYKATNNGVYPGGMFTLIMTEQ